MRQGGFVLAAGRIRSKKKKTKSHRIQNTPRNPPHPGDRDHLETACDETRPTRSPTLARFHRSRVCGNRHRTALEISTSREVNEARLPHTCSRPYAFEENKKSRKKNPEKIPPHPTHTTKSTAARRPRPRDGLRRNTSHALAHTRSLP